VSIGSTNLKEGTDYTVACDNNTNVGTATITITGKGNYTGTKTATFEIEPASITGSSITGLSTKTYTGKAITQTPVVKSGSTTLIEGSDYTVSYKNNTNPGTATVIITGSGNYTGTKEVTFTINAVGWIQESGEWYYYKNDGTKLIVNA
jgi:glucan-binding YG repeat protein